MTVSQGKKPWLSFMDLTLPILHPQGKSLPLPGMLMILVKDLK